MLERPLESTCAHTCSPTYYHRETGSDVTIDQPIPISGTTRLQNQRATDGFSLVLFCLSGCVFSLIWKQNNWKNNQDGFHEIITVTGCKVIISQI